ncbi:MAG: ABC transporter ATP-binding protein [Acidobacteria bacterium RIFCSPLOWO2_02_FULL_59_13]|nr:MAG: ABC transporter ATP-binding protein [Acidobacteria bacterium RIFCSPLOWO2_02_FULL_59_13]OGA71877.1 MAG: ABC transporter ATP-binding protein [Betaproteobacteria bacterium RIFCSPLOWO2_12_FULL_65_14]
MTTELLLEVQDLHAWYGDSLALHGVNFSVRKGETVSLIGRNGAGKSTTLKAIMGIVRKRSGAIRLRGIDLVGLPLHQVARAGIGYVPEDRGIFSSLDVFENLMLPPRIESGGFTLQQIYELFPNLLERRNSAGTKLSGGEQQMLAIARILRTGVKFLLLDEPTEGLAPVLVQRIGAAVRSLKKSGMTIVLVEQNFRFARRVADRFYVMEDGKIVDSFAAEELSERMGMLHETLRL